MLRRLRWPGVLNLELANLRTHGGLSPRMVRTMIGDGWEVDSHTLTHPDLTTVSDARLRRELVGSRAELRRRFGVPASFFCYPAGRYNPRVVAAVERAGYRGAVVEGNTLAAKAQPFELARLEVVRGLVTRSRSWRGSRLGSASVRWAAVATESPLSASAGVVRREWR